jgi:2-polyprenyl-3-methyl-5-hydroxy-6-metoxy-1,4-benzoquinol methylase
MRRRQIRDAILRVPVLGPAAVGAIRKYIKAVDDRRLKQRAQIVPGRFLALYKQRNGIDDVANITDPVKKLHVDFALSTLDRGTYARNRLSEFVSVRGKSYLDVGCAYGGFLVAFAHGGAKRIVGIDLNPELLDYARALIEDYGVEAEVRQLDVLAADRSTDLGRFDLITCNDVIEHVLDPPVALSRLVGLLEDDGVLYMEIPNRFSASFVLSDGHYRIFGLTALPKKEADRYYRALTGRVHDVTYKSLPFYINTLAKLGASSRLISYSPRNLPEKLRSIADTFEEAVSKDPPASVPPELQASAKRHIRRVARTYDRVYARYLELEKSDAQKAEQYGRRLFYAFGCDFWGLLIEKKRGGAPRRVRWSRGVE